MSLMQEGDSVLDYDDSTFNTSCNKSNRKQYVENPDKNIK